ncbi:trefoil factor 2-like [Pezoporus wallicus]|uniref:trefoil factor 2-like n=1 Tax=Pezoporus wallicus TaxID=35540 RepID=UPI00254D7754|nr:trefoil factor 2-like [Pezoporus wallicus]
MDLKVTCVLSVVLIIALSTLAGAVPTRCQCKMEPKERSNCGYPGITADQCRKAGCCFNSSVPGVPWCFSPKAKKVRKVCPADSRARINCGFPGITAKECEKKGCCFRSHPAGVPWCFYHRVVEEDLSAGTVAAKQVEVNGLAEIHSILGLYLALQEKL